MTTSSKGTHWTSSIHRGIAEGYRSGLEETTAHFLTTKGIQYTYEEEKIHFIEPAKKRSYTPDFILASGIIIETKGRFLTADRQKHLLIKAQYPKLDIRFVFSNSKSKLSKNSKTTYADWCIKNNFKYADKQIPEEWLHES
jgi:hypothetical protein